MKFSYRKFNLILLFLLSFFIVALGQADWSQVSCLLAASIGYALFWRAIMQLQSHKRRFLLALLWFASISVIHLNWLFSDKYVGGLIIVFLILFSLFLGLQFAALTLYLLMPAKKRGLHLLSTCGLWALLEWSRLFILTGFSWDPVGLNLSATEAGMQSASLVGVYGLSFWVILTNLLALQWFEVKNRGRCMLWVFCALLPYMYGGVRLYLHGESMNRAPTFDLLLVQPNMAPEEKLPYQGSRPLHPHLLWERLIALIKEEIAELKPKLIVFPEGAVPYGTDRKIYSQHAVEHSLNAHFPLFQLSHKESAVDNNFWAQKLADATHTPIIIGLESMESEGNCYNAALLFQPNSSLKESYAKQLLLPIAEYIPFKWARQFAQKYGIYDSFTPGKGHKIFTVEGCKVAPSICYEETFGHLMRRCRKLDPEMLINLTNDGWYPKSRLPYVHYLHGRLRAVELGLPLARACNTGVTCGIDALGRTLGMLPYETLKKSAIASALVVKLPLYGLKTGYSYYGDWLVVSFSLIFCLLFICLNFLNSRVFWLKNLNISFLRKN